MTPPEPVSPTAAVSAPPGASPDPRCRACSAPLESGKLFCARCGTPAPGAPTCPHCGSVADVAPHEEVRVVCKACGAPRIDVDQPGYVLPDGAIGSLRQAEQARIRRRRWRIAGAFGGIGAAGILSLALLVQLLLGFSAVGTTLAVLLALPLAIVAAVSVARSKGSSAEVEQAIDDAWLAAARTLTQQSAQAMTGADLARVMHLSEPATEKLSAQLAVDQLVDTDVTSDGQLAFGPGMRIEPPVAPAVAPPAASAPPAANERARVAAADTLVADPAAGAEAANAALQDAELEVAAEAAQRREGSV